MGKFPVISISLKGISGADYWSARSLICSVIGEEALRYSELLSSSRLSVQEKELYRKLINVDPNKPGNFGMPDDVLMRSLRTLSVLAEKHYGKKAIILIDEYDVPLAKANEQGYYDEMVLLIRNIFEQVLKTNDSLYFAVLTGCLLFKETPLPLGSTKPRQVVKAGFPTKLEKTSLSGQCQESIFTGLNNPKILSITTVRFDEYFGFTDDEIEALVAGEAVVKEIHEELTYNRLYDSINNIWSVLFMTGYLTYRERLTGKLYSLAIPNTEIRNIFTEQIMEMFKKNVAQDGKNLNAFCEALQKGDANAVQQRFSAYLNKTISIRDTFVKKSAKENFYHGIMLGILGYKSGWYVRSNKETGNGYSDIFIKDEENTGIILEIKYAENGKYESACKNALHQINVCGYADRLKSEGCSKILKYGIACFKKQCQVVVEIDGD
ncbi:hypothetical protein HNP82_001077 [Catenibacillus scindens]|uniref:AAA-ATPase-like domain-containing protein n=1 Tax=Catenibacillus scindens TaxID=673271 RepID=A0A7W8H8Y2_9FIRM|nr:hypothetical protein [Catenibacillus scindens]